jgi:hypothetical protein
MHLANVYRIFPPTASKHTFFSSAQKNLSEIDHSSGHTSSLRKHKKVEITSSILSDYNGIKLEINSKRSYREYSNT